MSSDHAVLTSAPQLSMLLRYRGVGESGMIAAPAALTNAIADALGPRSAPLTEQYLPPTRILELLGVV